MVSGGHNNITPYSLTYSSVVYQDSVRVALKISVLNYLKVTVLNIQDEYLTETLREKICTMEVSEFGSDKGNSMLVVRALCGVKLSRADIRDILSEQLHDLGYR